MYMIAGVSQYVAVASFMEAWIEMTDKDDTTYVSKSPPSWRRGLKLCSQFLHLRSLLVASFMEAWIEILKAA